MLSCNPVGHVLTYPKKSKLSQFIKGKFYKMFKALDVIEPNMTLLLRDMFNGNKTKEPVESDRADL